MNDLSAEFIFVGVVACLIAIGVAVCLYTHFTDKANNESLDRQISESKELSKGFVESIRYGSEVSLSESTKQIALADGKRPYHVSEIAFIVPKGESSSNSCSVSYRIGITMLDNTKAEIKCSDLDELVDIAYLLSQLAGRNVNQEIDKESDDDGAQDA